MECLKQLKEDQLELRNITTGPDTAAYKAAENFYQQGNSQTEPENLIDIRHLSENVKKKVKNDAKLISMMPAGTFQKERNYVHGLRLTCPCGAQQKLNKPI